MPILKSEQDTTYYSAAITSSSLESVSSYSNMPSRESGSAESTYFSGFDYNPDEENENEVVNWHDLVLKLKTIFWNFLDLLESCKHIADAGFR